jgi:hypothetical protein
VTDVVRREVAHDGHDLGLLRRFRGRGVTLSDARRNPCRRWGSDQAVERGEKRVCRSLCCLSLGGNDMIGIAHDGHDLGLLRRFRGRGVTLSDARRNPLRDDRELPRLCRRWGSDQAVERGEKRVCRSLCCLSLGGNDMIVRREVAHDGHDLGLLRRFRGRGVTLSDARRNPLRDGFAFFRVRFPCPPIRRSCSRTVNS